MGVVYNYGVPNEKTWGPGLDDQQTLEVFYRIQLWKEIAVTPDTQYFRNPAINPADHSLWVYGLRVRLAFQETKRVACVTSCGIDQRC